MSDQPLPIKTPKGPSRPKANYAALCLAALKRSHDALVLAERYARQGDLPMAVTLNQMGTNCYGLKEHLNQAIAQQASDAASVHAPVDTPLPLTVEQPTT